MVEGQPRWMPWNPPILSEEENKNLQRYLIDILELSTDQMVNLINE